MEIHPTIESVRRALSAERSAGRRIGFVPTMGALHEGHLSLVREAKRHCDVVVLSIFVNPLQFGAAEDLDRYPRPFAEDVELARSVGVDHVFGPTVGEMYPDGPVLTTVSVPGLTEHLEGSGRPGHFDGVATVVTKLLSIVGPCSAFFGEKDWQQLAVVRRLVSDLSLPVDVVGCPIVREADGLAMSSRNVYLDTDGRSAATALFRSLRAGVAAVAVGERSVAGIEKAIFDVLTSEDLVDVQYVCVVDEHLRAPEALSAGNRLLVAAKVGATRLIDNIGVVV